MTENKEVKNTEKLVAGRMRPSPPQRRNRNIMRNREFRNFSQNLMMAIRFGEKIDEETIREYNRIIEEVNENNPEEES